MEQVPSKRKAGSYDGVSRKTAKLTGNSSAKPKMSFAAKMMAKMGYQEGQGLGRSGDGILNPIEVKLRPQGVGVGAVREKTEQAKAEAKRQAEKRGEEIIDTSEEEKKAKRRRKEALKAARRGEAGANAGFSRPKIKYRTATEIEADADGLVVPNVLKTLVDATGTEAKVLTSTAGLLSTGRDATANISEAEKIAKRARRDLEAFAEQWNNLTERGKAIIVEEDQIKAELDDQEREIEAFRAFTEAAEALSQLETDGDDSSSPSGKWDTILSRLDDLAAITPARRSSLLADLGVASTQPMFKKEMTTWKPLQDASRLASNMSRLTEICAIDPRGLALQKDSGGFGLARRSKSTSLYESMMHDLWLPKLRSTIVNEWNVHLPFVLITVMETWKELLPRFIYRHLINNVIAQKLSQGIRDWNPRVQSKRGSQEALPHLWFFPWLPYLDARQIDPKTPDGLMVDMKRKIRVLFETWDLSQGVIPGIGKWRDVLGKDFDQVLLRQLLPRLAKHLSTRFEVDPSDQDLAALQHVLAWSEIFNPKVMAELLVAELFTKWLNVLHLWLTSEPKYDEVHMWVAWWRGQLPKKILSLPQIQEQWSKGEQMISHALRLGDRVKTELPKPRAGPARPIVAPESPKPTETTVPDNVDAKINFRDETTYRDIVEEWCAEENLLLLPLREAHASTGVPLFKITASASGKGGVVVFMDEELVWARDKKDKNVWEPFGLDEALVQRAEAK